MRIKRRDLKRLIRESIEPGSVKTKAFEEFNSLKASDVSLLNNAFLSISSVLDLNKIFGVEGYEAGLSESEMSDFNISKLQLSEFIKMYLSSSPSKESITDYIESISFVNFKVTYRKNGSVKSEAWLKYDKLHRDDDEPAYIRYRMDGSVEWEAWFKDGKRHRDDDKPASITYRKDGSVWAESWYKDGNYHRGNDKPAYVFYYEGEEKLVELEHWYKDGKYHRENDKPAYIRYRKDGSVNLKSWYKDGERHRDNDKPATIYYHKDGLVWSEVYYKDGVKYTP